MIESFALFNESEKYIRFSMIPGVYYQYYHAIHIVVFQFMNFSVWIFSKCFIIVINQACWTDALGESISL